MSYSWVTPSENNVYKNCRNLIRVGIFIKDCFDSGIEKGAFKVQCVYCIVHNGLLYDRSHPKNVYDDPYRLISFAPSPKAIFRRNTFGTPKFNQLVRRNETVIGAVWFRKLSTNNLNLHVLLATRTMSISLQTYKFDRDSWGMEVDLFSLLDHYDESQLPPDVGDPNYFDKFIIRRDPRRDMISINKLVEHEATDTCIWIERWIDNLQLKSDLQEARNTLQHRSKVNFYTDAIRNVKACLFHCPSSTRAELVAILLALLASPSSFFKGIVKEKHFFVLLKLTMFLTKNQIDLKLVKVKGRSGIELNEQVDKLAKEAGNIDSCFSNRFNYSHPNIRFFSHFLQHPIEQILESLLDYFSYIQRCGDSLKNNDSSTESTCDIIEWDITCRFLGSLSALDATQ
ncbi:hypothetical protein RhiirA4_453592 [Rhizophagus irregularis]|uniref:Uncharacterized protein n=1 Tax=Rhizophagus irregularis TaxID=588596 RepID=A0A2I1G0U5_9GLOM|nr:hypothetical protein RhiirA4_453592 [Rhizophagus irregularis]